MILNLMHNQLHFSSRRSVAEQDIILCPQQHVVPVTKETRNKNQVCHDVFSRNGLQCQSLGCPSNLLFAFKFHITLKQLMYLFLRMRMHFFLSSEKKCKDPTIYRALE